MHDPPHRTEQADERGRVGGGRKQGEGRLQAAHLLGYAEMQGAAHIVVEELLGVSRPVNAVELPHASPGNPEQGGTGVPLQRGEGRHKIVGVNRL